jgi:zinc protease
MTVHALRVRVRPWPIGGVGQRRGPSAPAALVLIAALWPSLAPTLEAAVRPPKLQYQTMKLPNGLTVILSEDHSVPIVHLEVWYHVGSKDERPGRTGFAHLFEHLMFKGSKNVEPEAHSSLISSVGGTSNAYTTEDVTVFWETIPAQYLPLMLWLEADRMATLKIDKDTLSREREVVKEERRMRVDNQPYGALSEIIYDQAFTVHPYKHTTIGRMADLAAASVEDVRDFYRTYYVPNNATLVLVGDFESPQAIQLVSEYLGRVPKSDRPIPRDLPQEPLQQREKRVTLTENWPLPVIVVAHHITYDGHPDSYPLHMAAKILSDGQSSRIYRKLVYERGIALSAFGSGNIVEDPNLFFTVAMVQPGHTLEEAEGALLEELERLKNEPVSDKELQRARNQFARDYIIGRETNQQKATQLAHAVVIHKGDITTADGEFDIFMKISAADIQRVARTYFTPERRVVLKILPAKPPATGGGTQWQR